MRALLAIALILASAAAYAQFNGCRSGVCPNAMLGRPFGPAGGGGGVAPPSCVAPTGAVDLSKCSNAFYVAVIL